MKKYGNGIKDKLSVIILSYALDDDIYHLNKQAIETLLSSEVWPSGSRRKAVAGPMWTLT